MGNQFLTFTLNGSHYAIEVTSVQGVLEYMDITTIPCTSPSVEGLINSRGQGISVVNLRKKFGMPDIPHTKETRIIVLEIKNGNDSVMTIGTIADSVHEVIDLPENEIEQSPKFGGDITAEFIRGIGKRDNKFIIILNIEKIFCTDEITN